MTDIFLSYNREDQARAKLFAEAFEAQGFKVWWDVGLRTGEAYDQVTERALKTAKAVVVLWSKKSVESRWVRAEATLADRNKTLVPCMIEPCERPIMFELTQTAELVHWDGSPSDKAWVAFLGDVKRFVSKEAAPTVATPAAPVAAPTIEETLKPGQSGSAPSLAVLPFTNRSGLPDDDMFAEAIVDDVISALSQGVNVRVLGASTTANLSRVAISDLAALGQQLGVRYLLEGNVRRMGANLRVTTQLLEPANGTVMWTGKFDRPLTELAALEEELVTEIAASLETQVYALEMERALKKPSDITAWEALARTNAYARNWHDSTLERQLEETARAIAIAPDYGPAVACHAAVLSNMHLLNAGDPADVPRIRALLEQALALAPDDVYVLMWVAEALTCIGFPAEALPYAARAVRKAPGSGFMHLTYCNCLIMNNQPELALSHANTAERLLPGSILTWGVKLSQTRSLLMLGCLAEADAAAATYLALDPTDAIANFTRVLVSLRLGQVADARKAIHVLQRHGHGLESVEHGIRGIFPPNVISEDEIAGIRALWAETDAKE